MADSRGESTGGVSICGKAASGRLVGCSAARLPSLEDQLRAVSLSLSEFLAPVSARVWGSVVLTVTHRGCQRQVRRLLLMAPAPGSGPWGATGSSRKARTTHASRVNGRNANCPGVLWELPETSLSAGRFACPS